MASYVPILQPPPDLDGRPIGRSEVDRRSFASHHGRLVNLPQTFLAWSFNASLGARCTRKDLIGIVRVTSCQHISEDQLRLPTIRSVVELWRNRGKYGALDGSYIRWNVENCSLLDSDMSLILKSECIHGGQPNQMNRIAQDHWVRLAGLKTCGGETLESIFGSKPPVLFQVVDNGLKGVFIVTPLSYATRQNVVVDECTDIEVVAASVVDAERLRREQERYRTASFQIDTVRMAWYLGSNQSLAEVLQISAALIAPGLDIETVPLPNYCYLRRLIIKLDLMHSLTRRIFYRPKSPEFRTARYLSPDGTIQGHRNYYCMLEELLMHPHPIQVNLSTCPFSDHMYQRRSMITQTTARRMGSNAIKIDKVAHMVLVENGQDNMWNYRCEVKGFLGDQAERGIPKGPFGDESEIKNVCASLKRGTLQFFEPRAKSICFFMNALDQPGSWHLFYNPIETAWTSLAEFKEMDTLTKAVVRVLGEMSYKELLLETTFKDAEGWEREIIHKFTGTIVDFKWQYRERMLHQVCVALPILVKYYRPCHLDTEGKLGADVLAACRSDFLQPFCEVQLLVNSRVGLEAAWMDGCPCHEEILTSTDSRYKRKKKMIEATGDPAGQCPNGWKGKRLSALALGHVKKMNQRIKDANSTRYVDCLVKTSRAIREKIVVIEHFVKDYVTGQYTEKFDYALHIPHSVAGGFGYLLGYGTLEESKECIVKCIAEFDAVADRSQLDYISVDLFTKGSELRVQYEAFGSEPHRDLRLYPGAYLETKERAFATNSEHPTEGEHVKVKVNMQRGLRFGKPAYVCARKRRHMISGSLSVTRERDWIVQHWTDRTIFRKLLEHMATSAACDRMTIAQRHALIYGYDVTHNHKDRVTKDKSVLALSNARAQSAAAPLPLTTNMRESVTFLKGQFVIGQVFSLPTAIFNLSLEGGALDASCHVPLAESDFANALQPRPPGDHNPRDCTFFEIIDPRPETKVQLIGAHLARSRSSVQAKVLDVVTGAVDNLHVRNTGRLEMINLARWCGCERFASLMNELSRWHSFPSDVCVRLIRRPGFASRHPSLAAPSLEPPPDFANSTIKAGQLALRNADKGGEIVPAGSPDGIAIKNPGGLRAESVRLAHEMLQLKCIVDVNDNSNSKFMNAVCSQIVVQELQEWGIIDVTLNDAGERCVALRLESLAFEGSLNLRDARSVASISSPEQLRKFAKFQRLELVQHLYAQGWAADGDCPAFFRQGGHKKFVSNWLSRPINYFRALSLAPVLFSKAGGLFCLSHSAPAAYYKYLIQCVDTSSFASMPDADVLALTDATVKATIQGLALAPGYAAPFAGEDSDDGGGSDGGGGGGGDVCDEEPDAAPVHAPIAVAKPIVGPEVERLEPVHCVVPGYPAMHVNFDMCVHQTGHRRAFTHCRDHLPINRCRLEVFVRDFASKEEACSYLFAWRLLSAHIPDPEDRVLHINTKPPPELVAAVHQSQWG